MMRPIRFFQFGKFLSPVLFLCIATPSFAQVAGNLPNYTSATYAARLSRYYAPYALQAAAAYVDVRSFDATRGPSNEPPLDGSDVQIAVSSYAADADVARLATKYLQSWQYQFGSDGYLRCLDNDADCLKSIQKDRWTVAVSNGPAFHVWARTRFPHKPGASCNEVSIAFRGTTLSVADWLSNLDPVSGYVTDNNYRQLRRNIDPIMKRIRALDCYRRAKTQPQIVSVGHSLGGGLAQMAALANNPDQPRINKVIAFDPSPVTGAPYVEKAIFENNVQGLEVDRVYQSGEVLQRLRKYYQQPPKSSSKCVRNVAYDFFQPAGSVVLHSMNGLAREMVRSSFEGEVQYSYEVPPRLPNCPSRYRSPTSDQDRVEVAEVSAPAISGRDNSLRQIHREGFENARSQYLANGGQFAEPAFARFEYPRNDYDAQPIRTLAKRKGPARGWKYASH